MNKIWIISDTHFGHKEKMMEYCGRPWDYELTLWEELYKLPTDCTLIHLGDICIGKDKEMHELIKDIGCKKILVKGNHDKKSKSWYMDHGWDFVCDRFSWKLHGKHIVFSHEPVKIPNNEYTINIHGHFHNATREQIAKTEEGRDKDLLPILTDRHKLIACELTDYKPVLLDKIANEQI